jgi:hypothetical protein
MMARQAKERLVDVIPDLPPDAQSPEPVQQRERLLHGPAAHAQAGPVLLASPGDDRCDPDLAYLLAVLVVVIPTISVDRLRSPSRTPPTAPHGWDRLDQGHELGDVVAVAAGQQHLQGDAVRFGDQMVFRASSGTVDQARSRFGPPFMARTWEPLITALDQSKAPAACNSGDWNDAGVWQRLHETRSRRPG